MQKRIGRPKTGITPNTSIRVNPDILHKARVAAVIQKKTMGRWLEEAILEKVEREQNSEGGSPAASGRKTSKPAKLRTSRKRQPVLIEKRDKEDTKSH
jgi:hypothetical protein